MLYLCEVIRDISDIYIFLPGQTILSLSSKSCRSGYKEQSYEADNWFKPRIEYEVPSSTTRLAVVSSELAKKQWGKSSTFQGVMLLSEGYFTRTGVLARPIVGWLLGT